MLSVLRQTSEVARTYEGSNKNADKMRVRVEVEKKHSEGVVIPTR